MEFVRLFPIAAVNAHDGDDLVRQELTETIHLNETLGIPSPRASEKLFAAIEAEQARAPRRRRISRTPSLTAAFSLNK
jgi:hypothetical protein